MKLFIFPLVFSSLTIVWEVKYIPGIYPPFDPLIIFLSAFLMAIWCLGSYITYRGTLTSITIVPFIIFQEFELTFNYTLPSFVFGISILILEIFFLIIITWLFALIESFLSPTSRISGNENREKIVKILEDLEYLNPP
ncbi:hypothetical protein ACNF40_00750 [Cuniculiplasma sp. SKW4]|uniref:hypothetical protein n=1 Tax=Cuniculiplasma sp. SKW4 TaxID=3400171 RepID=UPI003FD10A1B